METNIFQELRKLSQDGNALHWQTKPALAGNRTRASRVAGENSTTEPPVLGTHMSIVYFAIVIIIIIIITKRGKEKERR